MAFVEDRWVRKKDKTRTPVYGKGLRYRVEWVETGKKRRKSFANKALADIFLAEKNAELHRGVYPQPVKQQVLLSEYAAEWERAQLDQRASSLEQVGYRLRINIIPTLGHLPLGAITRRHVQEAVITWSETLAPTTVKVTYGFLTSILNSAVLDGHIPATPAVGIRLPRRERVLVRPLSVAQVQELVGVIGGPYRPVVVFCAATGLRGAEMRGLTWDRVDLDRGLVQVDRQLLGRDSRRPVWGPPKTQASERSITIGTATIDLLRSLPVDGVGGLVFTNGGGAITRGAASEAWRDARERLPHIGPGWHQLRHHHASLLIAGGMSPVAVAHRLGHKDATETLKTYAHLWSDDDQRAARISDGRIVLPPEDPLTE